MQNHTPCFRSVQSVETLLDQIIRRRYSAQQFQHLCSLDLRLQQLAHDISTMQVAQHWPEYADAWRDIERRLACVIRQPANPLLRTRHSIDVLHEGMRRLYWASAWESAP